MEPHVPRRRRGRRPRRRVGLTVRPTGSARVRAQARRFEPCNALSCSADLPTWNLWESNPPRQRLQGAPASLAVGPEVPRPGLEPGVHGLKVRCIDHCASEATWDIAVPQGGRRAPGQIRTVIATVRRRCPAVERQGRTPAGNRTPPPTMRTSYPAARPQGLEKCAYSMTVTIRRFQGENLVGCHYPNGASVR